MRNGKPWTNDVRTHIMESEKIDTKFLTHLVGGRGGNADIDEANRAKQVATQNLRGQNIKRVWNCNIAMKGKLGVDTNYVATRSRPVGFRVGKDIRPEPSEWPTIWKSDTLTRPPGLD